MSNQNNNDKLIKDLSKVAAKRLAALGKRPSPNYKTDMQYKLPDSLRYLNINVCNMYSCITIYRDILLRQLFDKQIEKTTGVDLSTLQEYPVSDWLHDIQLRISIIKWLDEKNLIKNLDKQLSDLRSKDAKTSDAIDNIAKLLN